MRNPQRRNGSRNQISEIPSVDSTDRPHQTYSVTHDICGFCVPGAGVGGTMSGGPSSTEIKQSRRRGGRADICRYN